MSAGPRVLFTFPPNYAAINKAFNVRGKPIIFAYGPTIYNPSRIKIPPQLYVHEAVHQSRQGSDPATWWANYITSPKFRLAEELPAHIAEYREFRHLPQAMRMLDAMAARLASPMYDLPIDEEEARLLIFDGASDSPLGLTPTTTYGTHGSQGTAR